MSPHFVKVLSRTSAGASAKAAATGIPCSLPGPYVVDTAAEQAAYMSDSLECRASRTDCCDEMTCEEAAGKAREVRPVEQLPSTCPVIAL